MAYKLHSAIAHLAFKDFRELISFCVASLSQLVICCILQDFPDCQTEFVLPFLGIIKIQNCAYKSLYKDLA